MGLNLDYQVSLCQEKDSFYQIWKEARELKRIQSCNVYVFPVVRRQRVKMESFSWISETNVLLLQILWGKTAVWKIWNDMAKIKDLNYRDNLVCKC